MIKFLKHLILFSIVVFAVTALVDYTISRGLLNMDDYRFQDYKSMLDGGMENDILILGNSRGKSHYDTRIIDSLTNLSSFCIGIGGYPLNVQLSKFQLYRKHNGKPGLIIQEADHAVLSSIYDVRYRHQSEQFFPLVYDPTMRKELRRMGYGVAELCIPMYRYYGYQQVIKNGLLEALQIKHYISRPAYKGHRPEEGAWDGSELSKMDTLEVRFSDRDKAMFEDYISECLEDSIKVVLVCSPLYSGAVKKMAGFEDALGYYHSVADSLGITFLDYTTDYPIAKDSSNFCVSVHMNSYATQAFTKQLCHDLKSLGLLP